MAKLYWRVKKDGKWTWKPAEVSMTSKLHCIVMNYLEEEE